MLKLFYAFFASIIFFSCASKSKTNNAGQSFSKNDTSIAAPSSNPYSVVDISPMDMSYFPVDYSKRKMAHDISTPPVMRVIYSRPHKQGRVIFGDLLKYGERWRLGANEASEIEFFENVVIQNKKINAGRYVIYCIPYPEKWTMILNNDVFTWGLKIDSTKDLLKFDIPIKKTSTNFEYFTMVFQPITHGAELVMAWDDTEARLPINF